LGSFKKQNLSWCDFKSAIFNFHSRKNLLLCKNGRC